MKTTQKQIVIASGFHVNKAEAAALVGFVEDSCGGDRPSAKVLLREARKKSSPLHGLRRFDWDQKSAAAKYLLDQADYYVRSLRFIEVNVKTQKVVSGPVRLDYTIERRKHRVIRTSKAEELRDGEDNGDREAVVNRARSELVSWLNRYGPLISYLGMFDPVIKAITEVEQKFKARRKRRRKSKA